MEYIDSWLFNDGQEITLWKGPKIWRVSVQLFNSGGYPFKYLEGRDKERLLLRALALIKRDVAKEGEEVIFLDQAHEHGAAETRFPVEIRTESQELEEFMESPEIRRVVSDMRSNIQAHELERRLYLKEGR